MIQKGKQRFIKEVFDVEVILFNKNCDIVYIYMSSDKHQIREIVVLN